MEKQSSEPATTDPQFIPGPYVINGNVQRYGTKFIDIRSEHVENGISYSVLGPIAYVWGHNEESQATAKLFTASIDFVKAIEPLLPDIKFYLDNKVTDPSVAIWADENTQTIFQNIVNAYEKATAK